MWEIVLTCKLRLPTRGKGENFEICTRLGFPFRDVHRAIPAALLLPLRQQHVSNPLVCVAVNEVFGNRERHVLASANSAACSSTAGSSSNDSETAMES